MRRPAFVSHADYGASIGEHLFPVGKYAATRRRLLDAGDTVPADWLEPPLATREELLRVHTAAYLDDFQACRWSPRTASSELPLGPAIVRSFVRAAGGTILACREALERGLAVHVGGGLHHAFADRAEGFCYINDIAVGIRAMQAEGRIARAAVIDCDVHQGNGTARIFRGDESVFTFSIHQERLYPVKEESDLDVGLADPAGDATYLAELERALPVVFERGRPELVVYQAGADPYEHDQLGNLGLTLDGLARRDRTVLAACAGRGVPCAVTLGGGYAVELADTVAIHAATGRIALEVARGPAAGDRRA